jgi:hypothetical protein
VTVALAAKGARKGEASPVWGAVSSDDWKALFIKANKGMLVFCRQTKSLFICPYAILTYKIFWD